MEYTCQQQKNIFKSNLCEVYWLCVHACMCECLHACMCVCVCSMVCVGMHIHVFVFCVKMQKFSMFVMSEIHQ